MNCLGIAIKKNEIWYSLVRGTNMDDAIILNSGKQSFQSDDDIKSLMLKFSNIFTELITKFSPDCIAYKLSLNTTMPQIPYMNFSLGVLNLLCKQKDIPINQRSNSWITAGNKSKITKCEGHFFDTKFKRNEEMQATLIA